MRGRLPAHHVANRKGLEVVPSRASDGPRRGRSGQGDRPIYTRRMNRRLLWILTATAVTSLLFASVSTSGGVNLWTEPQFDTTPAERSPVRSEGSSDGTPEPLEQPEQGDGWSLDLPAWVDAVLLVLFTMVGMAVLVALAAVAWRERPRLRWRRTWRGPADFEALPDVAAAVVDEAAAQRVALLSGAPRNAIVRCWLRLEHDVAAVGLSRNAADTSAEFTERVLSRYAVDAEAIHELAGLYREARFSEHPLDESSRQAALDALDRLHHALSARVADAHEPTVGAWT